METGTRRFSQDVPATASTKASSAPLYRLPVAEHHIVGTQDQKQQQREATFLQPPLLGTAWDSA